jgi:L-threonylcarbamoyladenylate synthase
LTSISDQIEQAVAVLAAGGVIAHPTETVFGLAANPDSAEALERLLALKGRAESKGFILLIPSPAILSRMIKPASLADPLVQALMARFWPGPLTLVLPVLASVSPLLTGGSGCLAVRHSSSALVGDLLTAWGGAIVSTSANRADAPVLRDHRQVRQEFVDGVGCVVSGHCSAARLPSTLLTVNAGGVRLLRSGAVPVAAIQAVLKKVAPQAVLSVAPGVAEIPPQ